MSKKPRILPIPSVFRQIIGEARERFAALLKRVNDAYRRRIDKAFGGLYGRSGPWARVARYPIPLLAPWRFKEIHLRRGGGIGDVLMCTPAIRELRRRNPRCRVHFYTDYPGLVSGLGYIDEVHLTSEAPPHRIAMLYEKAKAPRVHLARIIGDCLGLKVSDTTPDCVVDTALVERWLGAWRDLPRPHILIVRRASDWTPNKNWQDASWAALVGALSQFGTVIETGAFDEETPLPDGPFVDFRGKTSLAELIAAIAAADIYVGPITGAMHIAAAVRTPAIVIAGGYEHPRGVEYKGQTYLYVPVPCSPCWLRAPCPFDRRCLAAISPASVEELVREIWTSGVDLASKAAPRIVEMVAAPALGGESVKIGPFNA